MSLRAASTAAAHHGALTDESVRIAGSDSGPLHGLTFVAKDLFDVAGTRTGFGNPTWRDTHPPATGNAPAVQALLDAGATLVGKAHMDELAYSLNGQNAHYGTPRNPADPSRIPGGSSSGSAVAAAAGLVDFALGTDTAGSVRVPASYCGVLGMRPTHGRVPLEGACALASSYDTGGWFAQRPDVLSAVGSVLLSAAGRSSAPLTRWLVATDLFDLVPASTTQAIYDALSPKAPLMQELLGPPQELPVTRGLEGAGLADLEQWFHVYRITQGYEVWQQHGEWVTRHDPVFGPGVRERLQMAATITAEEARAASEKRHSIAQHLQELLGSNTVVALPAAVGPAPRLDTPLDELDRWRKLTVTITSLAGLAGLPQVSLPVAQVDGAPVGLGLLGPKGSDEQLLELAKRLMAS